jgi:hypothetical protein
MTTKIKLLSAAIALTLGNLAHANVIMSAVGATINGGGPGFGSISNTYDQSGLSSSFTSGTTDFDLYLATNPTHTLVYAGNEWFSNSGSSTASVTYDLGANYLVEALALWNEEASGISTLDLFGSTDGSNFSAISLGLNPADNPSGFDYSAEVFSFAQVDTRYIRFDMSGCPQEPSTFSACAIGEVAFSIASATGNAVPEPGTLALFGLGLAGLGMQKRRKA